MNKNDWPLFILQVDIKDPYIPIKDLTKICLLADLTLLLAWNSHEAGKIIETYKVFEHKPPDLIMEKQENSSTLAGVMLPMRLSSEIRSFNWDLTHIFHSQIADALTSIKSVNRTDAMTLLSNFQTLQNIYEASEEDLSLCPGIGPQKAKRLYRVIHEKFLK